MIKRGRQAKLEIFDIAKRVTAVYADPAAGAADAAAAGASSGDSGDGGAGGLAWLTDDDIEVWEGFAGRADVASVEQAADRCTGSLAWHRTAGAGQAGVMRPQGVFCWASGTPGQPCTLVRASLQLGKVPDQTSQPLALCTQALDAATLRRLLLGRGLPASGKVSKLRERLREARDG